MNDNDIRPEPVFVKGGLKKLALYLVCFTLIFGGVQLVLHLFH